VHWLKKLKEVAKAQRWAVETLIIRRARFLRASLALVTNRCCANLSVYVEITKYVRKFSEFEESKGIQDSDVHGLAM
jgi:hypothetical protein